MTQRPLAKVDWTGILLYYVLACAISWPLFYFTTHAGDALPVPASLAPILLMWGPGVAALCVNAWRPVKWRVTLLGRAPVVSGLLLVLPLALLVLALPTRTSSGGFPGGLGKAAFAALLAESCVRVVGEELGWRGYLLSALRPLAPFCRYAIVGVLWELWHVISRWNDAQRSIGPALLVVMLVVSFAISQVMGAVVERTQSLALAVAMHQWVNLAIEVPSWRVWGIGSLFVGALAGVYFAMAHAGGPQAYAHVPYRRYATIITE